MNKVASKIIESLLVASVLSLSSGEVEDTNLYKFEVFDKRDTFIKNQESRIIKNVLKFNSSHHLNFVVRYRFHYSHRSHRSGGSRCSSLFMASEAILGDRILSLGMYGSDVDMLIAYLKANDKLSSGYIETNNGMGVYNERKIISKIQEEYNLSVTGVCNRQTLKKIL